VGSGPQIVVEDLVKTFRVAERRKGMLGLRPLLDTPVRPLANDGEPGFGRRFAPHSNEFTRPHLFTNARP